MYLMMLDTWIISHGEQREKRKKSYVGSKLPKFHGKKVDMHWTASPKI